jgi:hypothetical protein
MPHSLAPPVLEDLVEKGTMPWLLNLESGAASVHAERKIG